MHGADFTNTFRSLSPEEAMEEPFREWHGRWCERLRRQPHSPDEDVKLMRAANPEDIPRNHLVEAYGLVPALPGWDKEQEVRGFLAWPVRLPKIATSFNLLAGKAGLESAR